MFKLNRWIVLAFVLTLVVAGPVLAQDGAYTLTIEGNITDANGAPAAFSRVLLTTDVDEGITAQTDIAGHFVLTGTVRGSQGELTVKSPNSDNVVFGTMPLSWAAGGFGEKTLVADLGMNRNGDMGVIGGQPPEWGGLSPEWGGTEAPLPAGGPDGDELPPSPTAAPTQAAPAPAVTPVGLPDAPQPANQGSKAGLIALLIGGGLLGLGLIGGGVWFLLKKG